MDTNPFAVSPNAQQPTTPNPYQTPDYLKQQANPTWAGAANNMVKALMDGNNKYKAAHPAMPNPTTPPVGAPMSLAPPAPMAGAPMNGAPAPTPMPGAPAPSPFDAGAAPMPFAPSPGMGMSGSPMGSPPGMPNGVDPTMQALFSQIPGQGSQFGG